jgi:hypothetical protein
LNGSFDKYIKSSSVSAAGTVRKMNFFDVNENESNIAYVKKSYYMIDVRLQKYDYLVDFFVVLKRENYHKFSVEGTIHSNDRFITPKRYFFISECEGSFGLLEFFIVPVFKTGDIGNKILISQIIAGDY